MNICVALGAIVCETLLSYHIVGNNSVALVPLRLTVIISNFYIIKIHGYAFKLKHVYVDNINIFLFEYLGTHTSLVVFFFFLNNLICYLPVYDSDWTSSDAGLNVPPLVLFAGAPLRICWTARIVWVASKDGPRGGTSGGAGSGGESRPLSDKIKNRYYSSVVHVKLCLTTA